MHQFTRPSSGIATPPWRWGLRWRLCTPGVLRKKRGNNRGVRHQQFLFGWPQQKGVVRWRWLLPWLRYRALLLAIWSPISIYPLCRSRFAPHLKYRDRHVFSPLHEGAGCNLGGGGRCLQLPLLAPPKVQPPFHCFRNPSVLRRLWSWSRRIDVSSDTDWARLVVLGVDFCWGRCSRWVDWSSCRSFLRFRGSRFWGQAPNCFLCMLWRAEQRSRWLHCR